MDAFNNATADDYIVWSEQALLAGWDTPALRVLAGVGLGEIPSFFEARPHFHRALQELGYSPLDAETAVRRFVDELAHEIVEGRQAPKEAVDLIHDVAITPLSHPPDLQPWCDLGNGLHPDSRVPVADAQLELTIRDFARTWLRFRGGGSSGAA